MRRCGTEPPFTHKTGMQGQELVVAAGAAVSMHSCTRATHTPCACQEQAACERCGAAHPPARAAGAVGRGAAAADPPPCRTPAAAQALFLALCVGPASTAPRLLRRRPWPQPWQRRRPWQPRRCALGAGARHAHGARERAAAQEAARGRPRVKACLRSTVAAHPLQHTVGSTITAPHCWQTPLLSRTCVLRYAGSGSTHKARCPQQVCAVEFPVCIMQEGHPHSHAPKRQHAVSTCPCLQRAGGSTVAYALRKCSAPRQAPWLSAGA